jgi:hypothetical protein
VQAQGLARHYARHQPVIFMQVIDFQGFNDA